MHLTQLISLALFAIIQVALGDGCHEKNDRIGKQCVFADREAFLSAAKLYCDMFDPEIRVPIGDSFPMKFYVPDGFGDVQIFFGNLRLERGDDKTNVVLIQQNVCMSQMEEMWDDCGGCGGWINTSYGTIFGECIKA